MRKGTDAVGYKSKRKQEKITGSIPGVPAEVKS